MLHVNSRSKKSSASFYHTYTATYTQSTLRAKQFICIFFLQQHLPHSNIHMRKVKSKLSLKVSEAINLTSHVYKIFSTSSHSICMYIRDIQFILYAPTLSRRALHSSHLRVYFSTFISLSIFLFVVIVCVCVCIRMWKLFFLNCIWNIRCLFLIHTFCLHTISLFLFGIE